MKTIQEIELLSWKSIWTVVQSGKHRQIQRAIDDHVERFQQSEQDHSYRARHTTRTRRG